MILKGKELLEKVQRYVEKYPDCEFVTATDDSNINPTIDFWLGRIEGKKFVDVEGLDDVTAILIF